MEGSYVMNLVRNMKQGGVLLSAIILTVVSACAVRTQIQKMDPESLRGNLRFENVMFKEFTTASNVVPPAGALYVCQESSIAYLREKGLFKQVDKYSEDIIMPSTAVVEGQLLDIRIVSTSARVWGGSMAGRSHMKMKVRMVDAESGEVLAEQELMGAPNSMGSTWTFGSSDRNLPASMGDLIGDFVLANAKKK